LEHGDRFSGYRIPLAGQISPAFMDIHTTLHPGILQDEAARRPGSQGVWPAINPQRWHQADAVLINRTPGNTVMNPRKVY